jgi:hypothetical protein
MDRNALEQNYSWDQPLKGIWTKLCQSPPDTPHYQKLALLVQLRTAAVASYTKWIVLLTWAVVACTVVQTIVAVWAVLRH